MPHCRYIDRMYSKDDKTCMSSVCKVCQLERNAIEKCFHEVVSLVVQVNVCKRSCSRCILRQFKNVRSWVLRQRKMGGSVERNRLFLFVFVLNMNKSKESLEFFRGLFSISLRTLRLHNSN